MRLKEVGHLKEEVRPGQVTPGPWTGPGIQLQWRRVGRCWRRLLWVELQSNDDSDLERIGAVLVQEMPCALGE